MSDDKLTDAERERRELYDRPPAKRVEFEVLAIDLDRNSKRCRYCPATIVWQRHPTTGKAMPLDRATAREAGPGRLMLESHYARCPGAEQARRKPGAERRR